RSAVVLRTRPARVGITRASFHSPKKNSGEGAVERWRHRAVSVTAERAGGRAARPYPRRALSSLPPAGPRPATRSDRCSVGWVARKSTHQGRAPPRDHSRGSTPEAAGRGPAG